MPLVSATPVLRSAMAGGYAVGAFNANNAEMLQAIVEAAQAEDSPVILQISPGAIKYLGLELASAMVRTVAELASIPVVLHLDHGMSLEQNEQCLRAGFTSLMYDGSAELLEHNIATTAAVVEFAHAAGVPVEAELGRIPRIEDYESMLPAGYDYSTRLPSEVRKQVRALMADPEQAARFAEETGCDFIAAAIGSVHGMKRAVQPLDIERLDMVRERTGLPLVLHGASGVICTRADADAAGITLLDHEGTLEDAIRHGVSKINVGTEVSMEFVRGISDALARDPGQKDARKVIMPGKVRAKQKVREYIRLFGSSGKAKSGPSAPGIQPSEVRYHE